MQNKDTDAHADMLSPKEMREWLQEEIRDSAKAHELRVREASDLVAAYAMGDLTPVEASKKLYAYDTRWGEALYGASAFPGTTDEQILNAIDNARAPSRKHESLMPQRRPLRGNDPGERTK